MDERELEILAGKLARLGQTGEKPPSKLVELGDAALDGSVVLEETSDEGIGLQRCERLGVEIDLHDEFIASGCDTLLVPLPYGLPWCVRPGGGPNSFYLAPGRFRPWRCHRGSKSAEE